MIITLTGSRYFGLHKEASKRINDFIADYGDISVEKIDGEEASLEKIRESLASLPFLASKKLVYLREPSSKKQFIDEAEQILSEIPETTELIIYEPKLDKRTNYYKFLKSKTEFREFSELSEPELIKWVCEYAKELGGQVSSNDARYLVLRVGSNQDLLANEIQKLILYSPTINRETIELLSPKTIKSTIFELLDNAFSGRKAEILKIYEQQRLQKVEPQQIIAMLAWQLHILAIIIAAGDKNSADIAREAKINPFVVQKTKELAQKINLEKLKKLLKDLLSLDTESKTLSIDTDDALKAYLLAISP